MLLCNIFFCSSGLFKTKSFLLLKIKSDFKNSGMTFFYSKIKETENGKYNKKVWKASKTSKFFTLQSSEKKLGLLLFAFFMHPLSYNVDCLLFNSGWRRFIQVPVVPVPSWWKKTEKSKKVRWKPKKEKIGFEVSTSVRSNYS